MMGGRGEETFLGYGGAKGPCGPFSTIHQFLSFFVGKLFIGKNIFTKRERERVEERKRGRGRERDRENQKGKRRGSGGDEE